MVIEFIDGETHDCIGIYDGQNFRGFSKDVRAVQVTGTTHVGVFEKYGDVMSLIKVYPINSILCIHLNESSLRDSKISKILK